MCIWSNKNERTYVCTIHAANLVCNEKTASAFLHRKTFVVLIAAETKTVADEQIDMDIVQIQNYPLNSYVAQVWLVVSVSYFPHSNNVWTTSADAFL